jgi:serine/threonine-protein kinase HipA
MFYCYQPLKEDEQDFHTVCAKKMFGTKQAPIIDFNLKQLEELAKQIVIKSVAVTGVQPKLSLEIEKHKNRIITPYHCRFARQLYFKTTINRI